MAKKVLSVNILNFKHKTSELTFRFTPDKVLSPIRVSRYDLPGLLPDLSLSDDCEELYVIFDAATTVGKPLTRAVTPTVKQSGCWSFLLLKKYYCNLLLHHFRSQNLPCRIGFAKDVCVYVPAKSGFAQCSGYREYRVRVQFGRITNNPELVISSGEVKSVWSGSLSTPAMQDIQSDLFTWVMFRSEIFRYSNLPDEARRHPDEVYPMLNRNLISCLSLTVPAPSKQNRYIRYCTEIDDFKKKYLLTDTLKEQIDFVSEAWVQVPVSRIDDGEELTDELQFGNGRLSDDAYKGMRDNGPKQLVPNRSRIFFFVAHQDDVALARTIHSYLTGSEKEFPGLMNYAKIPFTTKGKQSLFFANRMNPLPELHDYLQNMKKEDGVQYVALYLTPISKHVDDAQSKAVYYKVKEALLRHDIVSQAVEVDKTWGTKREVQGEKAVLQSNFHYYLPNIAIALTAKLGGIPWGLKNKEIEELVIGVGAFRNVEQGANFMGSAFCFSGEGRFYGFDYFRHDEINGLVGSIIAAVRRYCEEQSTVRRLIIHFYKNMSREELEPIERGLGSMDLSVPVYVVTINKTEATDYFAFDTEHTSLMPLAGTYVSLGKDQYLLYNNTVTSYASVKQGTRFHFPLKTTIHYYPCQTNEEETDQKATIPELLKQVILFSRLYWKSVSKQTIPVTIKYPELLAEMAPYFDYPELPKTGKETLWFL